jgi:hypothetical protein
VPPPVQQREPCQCNATSFRSDTQQTNCFSRFSPISQLGFWFYVFYFLLFPSCLIFFCNRILFPTSSSTFSKLCKNMYTVACRRVPLVTEKHYWALFCMPLVTEERYWAHFYMQLYTFLHNLLYVLVEIGNKTGLRINSCLINSPFLLWKKLGEILRFMLILLFSDTCLRFVILRHVVGTLLDPNIYEQNVKLWLLE